MKSIKVCEYSRSRSFHDDLILQNQASGERSQDQWSSGINHDRWMTLTYFMVKSTWVAHVFEWGKLFKCHLKGKTCSKLANGLNFYDLKKTLTTGVILTLPWGYIHITILVKQV